MSPKKYSGMSKLSTVKRAGLTVPMLHAANKTHCGSIVIHIYYAEEKRMSVKCENRPAADVFMTSMRIMGVTFEAAM